MLPLFNLLKKGKTWSQGADHKNAWQEEKKSLQEAPVIGHPIEGLPYQLYIKSKKSKYGVTPTLGTLAAHSCCHLVLTSTGAAASHSKGWPSTRVANETLTSPLKLVQPFQWSCVTSNPPRLSSSSPIYLSGSRCIPQGEEDDLEGEREREIETRAWLCSAISASNLSMARLAIDYFPFLNMFDPRRQTITLVDIYWMNQYFVWHNSRVEIMLNYADNVCRELGLE
ncbi:hypothetical protein ARMGADRAFT_1026203 [Armillaria gallica]|uniref:Uncharacterized protein n=1 Tax=Armillaria gallica TaxID=47427 RepID=A0A2H3E316_ARMGA|nr:hypothetical protein ARMGADRAFT_1026203 [Armillaria gallica]